MRMEKLMSVFWKTERNYKENYKEEFPVILAGVNSLYSNFGEHPCIYKVPCNLVVSIFWRLQGIATICIWKKLQCTNGFLQGKLQ